MAGHSADTESVGGGPNHGLSVPRWLPAKSCCGNYSSITIQLQFRIPMIYGFTIHEHLLVDLQCLLLIHTWGSGQPHCGCDVLYDGAFGRTAVDVNDIITPLTTLYIIFYKGNC
jgi:hypothetical protein